MRHLTLLLLLCWLSFGCRPKAIPLLSPYDLSPEEQEEQFGHLDIDGFSKELINGWATFNTSNFNDYVPISYHVEKLELAQHIQKLARDSNPEINALIITGPGAMMWGYKLTLIKDFDSDSTKKRVNFVSFPHARITYKATNEVSNQLVDSLYRHFETDKFLNKGKPTVDYFKSRVSFEGTDIEHKYDLLILFKTDNNFSYYWGYSNSATSIDFLDKVLEGSVTTYSH